MPSAQYNTLPTQSAVVLAQLEIDMRPPQVNNPDRINTEPSTSADTAGWFWAKNRLISIADTNNVAEMTRKIRGDGPNVGITTPWPEAANFPRRQEMTEETLKYFRNFCE